MNNCAAPFLGRRLIEARIAHESSVRSFDDPHVVGNRGHLVMWVTKDVVFRSFARVGRVTDRIDLVNIVAHGFFSVPTVTPARRSIILTMAVKSLSPPNSVLVASH